MQIDIRGQNVAVSGALAAHCLERVERALRPFGSRIARVQVVFVDVNGPKILRGQSCRMRVDFRDGGGVRFESRTDNYYQSASETSAGIVRPIQRALERRRNVRRPVPDGPSPAA